jgi:hypothetical protein
MKSMSRAFLSVMLFSAVILASTSYDVTMEKKLNYNNWGNAWDTVVVVKNNIITIAAVPKLGGRIMKYDLGTHPSIYINPYIIDQPITDGGTMVGGFRQLPSPQSDFNWPAPDSLDFGQYKCLIKSNTADSCVVYLESPIETSSVAKYVTHKGLQYKRTLTMYKASSRVKVEMVMVNTSATTLTHGIWDITQTECGQGDTADIENMWVYFPLNPQSTLGHGKKYVEYQGEDTTQWNKDIVPGIMGVQYKQVVAKIGADCKAGWICFVDRRDGYAYVKTFTYKEGKTYPDSGASVQVYTYSSYNNTEVEVLGPITALAQNKSDTMIENWYAARTKGPIYSVNTAGLVAKPISAANVTPSGSRVAVKGSYGVFYPGKVKAVLKSAAGAEVAVADSYAVAPTDSFVLNDTLKIVANVTKVCLVLSNSAGKVIGTLDSIAVTAVGASGQVPFGASLSTPLSVARKGNSLVVTTPYHGDYRIELTGIDGRQLLSLRGQSPTTHSFELSNISAGVIFVRAHHAGMVETKRVVVR